MKYPTRADVLMGTAVLALTALFFVPFSLFLTNRDMFFAAPARLAALLLAVAATAFLLLSLPALLMRGRARHCLLSLLAFFSAAIWAQAYLLSWDYGLLDGSPLRWRLLELRSLVDASVWTILFGYIVLRGMRKNLSFRTLLIVLLFIQVGNLVYCWNSGRTGAPARSAGNLVISFRDQFTFSSEKNIVILVLDAYQTDFFNQYIESNPDHKDKLPGFVYYPNAIAEYHFTHRSVPTLMTGNHLNKGKIPAGTTFRDYRDELLLHHSIPGVLKKAGYHVGIYPYYASNIYPPSLFGGIADNYVATREFARNESNEISGLMAVSLFRSAPHLLKKRIHHRFLSGVAFEQDRDEFLHGMRNQSRVGMDAPAFRYYHLQGLHGPYIVEGKLLDRDERDDVLILTGLVNALLADLVATLQELDVYDATTIFVLADHGLYHDSHRVEYGRFGDGATEQDAPPLEPFVKKCRALPLFLFKPAQAEGAMRTSRAPVGLVDVLPTVLDILGITPQEKCDGLSVLQITEESDRLRRHFTNDVVRRDSEAPDYEYIISGFSWHDSSWLYTGNVHYFGRSGRRPLDNYLLGTGLHFGVLGTGIQYLDARWRPLEHAHLNDAPEAALTLPLANPGENMVLRMDVAPHRQDGHADEIRLSLFINDKAVGVFPLSQREILNVDIPDDPAWTGLEPKPEKEETQSGLWDWSPKPPTLSEAVLEVRMEVSGINEPALSSAPKPALELFSLRIDAVS